MSRPGVVPADVLHLALGIEHHEAEPLDLMRYAMDAATQEIQAIAALLLSHREAPLDELEIVQASCTLHRIGERLDIAAGWIGYDLDADPTALMIAKAKQLDAQESGAEATEDD